MDRNLLKQVILEQSNYNLPSNYIQRDIDHKIDQLFGNQLIIIITGIRRSGKSVLLKSIREKREGSDYYLNFDDDRLINFSLPDFQILLEVFIELFGTQKSFYFDEIQNIPGWERFIRRLHDQGNKIFITGSNASMLSKELGTKLTGRHITLTIYPYSFNEYIKSVNPEILNLKNNIYTTNQTGQLLRLFSQYCQIGGMPEYVYNKQKEYIHSLYENIIYKDIIVRYKLTKEKTLKELIFFIASNIGKSISFNSLRKTLGLGNASTISDYFYYLENSFLCFLINRYNYSLKKQILSEKKQYFIDHGMAQLIGFRSSADSGRILENIVFIELLRRGYNIYTHKEDKECDFLLRQGNKVTHAIQVCKQLDEQTTKQREYDGLLDAMVTYDLKEGLILTENLEQEDTIKKNNKTYKIYLQPIWKWLLRR